MDQNRRSSQMILGCRRLNMMMALHGVLVTASIITTWCIDARGVMVVCLIHISPSRYLPGRDDSEEARAAGAGAVSPGLSERWAMHPRQPFWLSSPCPTPPLPASQNRGLIDTPMHRTPYPRRMGHWNLRLHPKKRHGWGTPAADLQCLGGDMASHVGPA
jgi:hypothetical protein